VLETALNTKASGLTAPAAALYEFYEKKIYVSCFVLISDEIENQAFKGLLVSVPCCDIKSVVFFF
jgi:hypothetical protein